MDKKNADQIFKMRHSAEHVLTQAMRNLGYKFHMAMGPAIDDGFYFDFELLEGEISEANFPKIEKEMKKIIKLNLPITQEFVSVERARELFRDNPYKQEWIDEAIHEGEKLSIYWTGEPNSDKAFVDLCIGPHVKSTSEVGEVKLLSIAGAYWRGSEKNKMLTRIYGTAFETKKEVDDYVELLEEAKKRDHRKIGKEQKFFTFNDEIGQGLPIWLPRGNIIKEELENWAKDTETKWGYKRVTTPIITKEDLFYTSGHLPLYKDSMYAPIEIEKCNYYIKPMNCPFHHKVFDSDIRSYKDLPYRIAEYGLCHRYEDSGSLFGLMRVRGMDMNDAHIYCTMDQAVDEFIEVIRLHEYYYKMLGIKNYSMELALRNPENKTKYHGEEKDWKTSEELSLKAMEKSGVPYTVVHDGAAFYGPKMDFQVESSIGRQFTASTNQLDLYMGKRFGLKYTDEKGLEQTPAIIHRAPLGTHERFIGFLIEHFGGAFPVWLHPEQVMIIPIGKDQMNYANEVKDQILESVGNARIEIDRSDETLQKKIRNAQLLKVPYMIVIGKREEENKTISVRLRTGKNLPEMGVDKFSELLDGIIKSKSLELE